MSPLSRLARLLKVKEKIAWDFYLEIRNQFTRDFPDIQAITNCIIQKQLENPTPLQVTKILKGTGSSNVPPRNEKPVTKLPPKDDPKPPLGIYQKMRRRRRSGDSDNYSGRSGALRPGHDTRFYNEPIPRCPHGILTTKKCAICDPKGFATSNGND